MVNFSWLLIICTKNIKSCISHNGAVSASFISEIGVRQGENLSPVLFSMYLNDLQTYLQNSGTVGVELFDHNDLTLWLKLLVLLYADDTILLSNTAENLQICLNNFNDYCKNWHLKVNINKTKIVIFGARQTGNFRFNLGDENIEISDSYHYLGVTFSSNGSFLKARKHVVQQATKAMYLLFTKSNNSDLPLDLIIKLFDHTVLPILTYGSEIFGFENLDILEKVHNEFLRKITKSRKSTPLYMLMGELGRYPISIIIKTRMISFWNRLIKGKENKISFQLYKYMTSFPNHEFKWTSKIRDILNSVGRPDLWQNQTQINHLHIHKLIKQILIDQYKQSWYAQLQQSNKGLNYKSFKEDHKYEEYFKILEQSDYISLFKFRTSNHKLPVEVGRYDGTPYNERLCTLCSDNQTGTEQHYLLHCSFFGRQREHFFQNANLINERELSLKSLLGSNNIHVLRSLVKFINSITKTFQ